MAKAVIKAYLLYTIAVVNLLASFAFTSCYSCLSAYTTAVVNARSSCLCMLVLLAVLMVSSCVILNSIDYLSLADSPLFLGYILMFQLTMAAFILASDFLLAFVCWDVLGIISYLLVNFWASRINCGVKALIFNKVGDCSFALVLALSYSHFSFSSYYPFLPMSLACSLFLGFLLSCSHTFPAVHSALAIICFTKSAQLPFSSWLLNAMSAPTPISALLHSSTMVIAGVVVGLIVDDVVATKLDSCSLFSLCFVLGSLLTLLWSLVNAVFAADVKSVIAYSTVSQISYMFVALLINPCLCLYHIIIHAVFKSSLFLLAGSLIHSQKHHQSINRLRIKHSLAKTALLAGGGVLTLSISKEAIIYSSCAVFSSLFISLCLVVGSLCTIIYTFNLYVRCFHYAKWAATGARA